jgi:carbon storage regulator CsrA
MLVIARQYDEETVLRDSDGKLLCRVKVMGIRGDKVRLGFDAPQTTVIDRAEVDDAKQQEQRLREREETGEQPGKDDAA